MPGSEPHTTPRLAALAVVAHQGRLLLVQRAKDPDALKWGFPGGHVELGETVHAAAARELMEETGVIAMPRRTLLNLDIITHDAAGAVAFHFLLVAVQCDYVEGTPTPADDALAAKWIAFDDVSAERLPLSANVARVMREALKPADI